MAKNHEILGVQSDATSEQIQAAFDALSTKFNPNKFEGTKHYQKSVDAMKKINIARAFLKAEAAGIKVPDNESDISKKSDLGREIIAIRDSIEEELEFIRKECIWVKESLQKMNLDTTKLQEKMYENLYNYQTKKNRLRENYITQVTKAKMRVGR